MSDHKSTLTAILVDGVSGPARQIKAEITGLGSQINAVSSVLQGIGLAIGENLFRGFEAAFSRITELIPDLIQKGNDYLGVLKQIQLETGLTAEQTSGLAGIAVDYGVSVGSLSTLLARLGTNVVGNEKAFKQFGIATRDSKGVLLDTWTQLDQVRKAISSVGNSAEAAAIANKLFGRSGTELLPILSLTDDEFKKAGQSVASFGGIVSQAAIDGAEKFKRGLDTLQQGVVDIGTNIAAALDPYLEQFIANFTAFVQQHLNDIVNFFVTVTNAVVGFVSGLLGITNTVSTIPPAIDSVKRSTVDYGKVLADQTTQHNQLTAAIQSQIKAIDAHAAAITAREQARHAARERERLAQSLSDAQNQLADLRGNAPFTAGLSSAEQQLAIQKHAQDIIDAEKNVADQRKAIGDFELNQRDQAEQELLRREKSRLQERMTATNAAFKAEQDAGLRLKNSLENNLGPAWAKQTLDIQRFAASAKSAFDAGSAAAKTFLDFLLGAETFAPGGQSLGRQGGVVGAIKTLGGVFQFFLDHLNIIIPAIGLLLVANVASSLIGMLGTFAFAVSPQGALMIALGASIAIIDQLAKQQAWVGPNSPYTPALGGSHATNNPGGMFGIGSGIFKVGGSAGGGWVGVNGPELRLVGEEGPEYVVANDQLGRGRGGIVVHNHFDFISMPSRAQLRELADSIDEIFQMKADNAPVGVRG